MNPQQEQILVNKAQNGDKEALGRLWDELTPKLFGYLVNVTRNKPLAEDLLQSVWLKAIEALPRFVHRGAGISAWLFAIARNECKQHWRKTKYEQPLDDTVREESRDDSGEVQDRILVEQILALLSEDDRELLRLRYIADLPINDIGKILNINFVAVRVRLHRALARARAALETPKNL